MLQLIWLYLTALLYYRTSVSSVALAEALETVSHDRLTRWFRGNWSGHTLLNLAIRTRFVWERGSLMIDDTVLAKPFATAIEGLAWVFSSQEQKTLYGLPVVLLIWTNGTASHPVGHAAVAQRRAFQGRIGARATQLRPQSLALLPRLCPV
jgi:hypothetical protein